jgi:hypothetical protein
LRNNRCGRLSARLTEAIIDKVIAFASIVLITWRFRVPRLRRWVVCLPPRLEVAT